MNQKELRELSIEDRFKTIFGETKKETIRNDKTVLIEDMRFIALANINDIYDYFPSARDYREHKFNELTTTKSNEDNEKDDLYKINNTTIQKQFVDKAIKVCCVKPKDKENITLFVEEIQNFPLGIKVNEQHIILIAPYTIV